MTFNELADEIYEQNKAVGWWDDPDRCIYQTLQLVSTEIAEATEGERKNLMDDHLPHRKMGEVELADALIRLLDLAGRYQWHYMKTAPVDMMITFVESIAAKHLVLNKGLIALTVAIFDGCHEDRISKTYSALVNGILEVARSQDYDTMGAMMEKLTYNKKRDDHKRENRQKEGGKAF